MILTSTGRQGIRVASSAISSVVRQLLLALRMEVHQHTTNLQLLWQGLKLRAASNVLPPSSPLLLCGDMISAPELAGAAVKREARIFDVSRFTIVHNTDSSSLPPAKTCSSVRIKSPTVHLLNLVKETLQHAHKAIRTVCQSLTLLLS